MIATIVQKWSQGGLAAAMDSANQIVPITLWPLQAQRRLSDVVQRRRRRRNEQGPRFPS